jgi:hypothetical protein
MANRFSKTTTSQGFKALSLDEILTVPLAKQAQHDSAAAELDAYAALNADVDEIDRGLVNTEIQGFRDRSDQLSADLLSGGINRSKLNQMRSLRADKNKSFSTGLVGRKVEQKLKIDQNLKDVTANKS